MRKFARRHKALVGGIAAVFVVWSAGIVATAREAIRARQAEQKALRAEQTAQAVNSFLQEDLLAQARTEKQGGPAVKPDPDIKVRTALDRAAARVGTKFKDRPMVEASIRQTLGRTYRDLGLYPEAQTHLERAYEISKKELGENHSDLLLLLDDLASVYYFRAQYPLAIPLVEKLADIKRRTLGPEHPETLTALSNLGLVYSFAGNDQKAEEVLRPVVEIRRRVSGDKDPESLTAMGNLAQVLQRRARLAEAEPLFLRTIEVSREVKGEEHPSTLSAMNNLSQVYRDQGRLADAERVLSQTLEIRAACSADEHPNTLTTINNLANIQLDSGKIAEAEAAFTKLIDVRTARHRREPSEHADDAEQSRARVPIQGRLRPRRVAASAGQRRAAAASGREASRYARRAEQSGIASGLLRPLRRCAGDTGEGAGRSEEKSRPEHPDTLIELERLGLVAQAQRQYAKSEELLGSVLSTRRKTSANSIATLFALAPSSGACISISASTADATRVLAPRSMDTGPPIPKCGSGTARRVCWGEVSLREESSEAEPLLVGSHEGSRQAPPDMPKAELHYLDDAARTLADLYRESGQADRAEEWSRKLTTATPSPADKLRSS